jgi:hypothetical protein
MRRIFGHYRTIEIPGLGFNIFIGQLLSPGSRSSITLAHKHVGTSLNL